MSPLIHIKTLVCYKLTQLSGTYGSADVFLSKETSEFIFVPKTNQKTIDFTAIMIGIIISQVKLPLVANVHTLKNLVVITQAKTFNKILNVFVSSLPIIICQ